MTFILFTKLPEQMQNKSLTMKMILIFEYMIVMEHFLKLSAVQYVCFSAVSSNLIILGFLKLLQLKMCKFFMLFFFSLFITIFSSTDVHSSHNKHIQVSL